MNHTETHDTAAMTDAEARREIKDALAALNCRVHQPDDPPLFTREPHSAMRAVHWRWSELVPLLHKIGGQMRIGSGGQRRTLRLHNPGLPFGTTPTFWASLQVILPGEIAQAHRHSANAFRFILQGSGCTTTVQGEQYDMNEGDLVLTPAWAWHDHEHHGAEPMFWLDVLDISLMHSLHATFFEGHPQQMQKVGDVADRSYKQFGSGIMRPPNPRADIGVNPLLAYPRDRALAALDEASALPSDPCSDVVLEYQNPTNGASAMTTMGMRLQKLRSGFRGKAIRHTGSKLYCVASGSGTTIVEGWRFDWSKGDFLAVPPWSWHEHHVDDLGTDATMFSVDDTPTLRALGYYREEMLSVNQGHQMVQDEK